MSADVSGPERVIGRPFAKGISGNPGGKSKATTRLRKSLAKLDPKAVGLLERFMDSDMPELQLEALKLWFRYRLAEPKETPDAPGRAVEAPSLPPAVRERLARIQ